MLNLTIDEICRACGGTYRGNTSFLPRRVSGVFTDSRDVKSESVFAAVPGKRVDGHSFIPSAAESGAICILEERRTPDIGIPAILVPDSIAAVQRIAAFYRTKLHIPVVGITGSVGKTSAKEMTASVLSQQFRTCSTPMNRNNTLGASLTLLSIRDDDEAAVLEMGIEQFGEMSELAGIVRPTSMIYTNIAPCHLESLGDLDGVLRAKTEALAKMPPDSTIYVNGDDPRLRGLDPAAVSPIAAGFRKVTFGRTEECDLRAVNIRTDNTGILFTVLQDHYDALDVRIDAYGAHLVDAALPAIAAGRDFGIPDEKILAGIQTFRPVENHATLIHTPHITIVSDCYNSSPKAAMSALDSLSCLPGRKVAILGTMLELGSSSAELHRAVGHYARGKNIDLLVGVGSMAKEYCDSMPGTMMFDSVEEFCDRAENVIQDGDVVLVKASHGEHFERIVDFLQSKF